MRAFTNTIETKEQALANAAAPVDTIPMAA